MPLTSSPSSSVPVALGAEFDRQVDVLLQTGYPAAAGLSPATFAARLQPLKARLADLDTGAWAPQGVVPFVLVIGPGLVPVDGAITRVERRGRRGFAVIDADDLAGFTPIDGVEVPAGDAHLIADVDLGFATRNVPPEAALPQIEDRDRSVLTIDEGVALVTQFPEAVAENAGFSLVGSRCGDRRVTALWISKGAPKLGWCWAGAPHTWLGSASCARRLGAED
ncbi:MAG TPA: DUF5701 family protein [Baekduia sp.]|uniref:DUF5701 family protein n=1 Tax=Baekduia sp. TaxID=2600305 RepID=UPI002D173199|nr:DUF5701 family protein [Baekduia sp.]HMJ33807.1 DUF5701 family protein [Baekduia sp.]